MITMNKKDDSVNKTYVELYGLSTDEKPTGNYEGSFIGNGSTFLEMDTTNVYIYDQESETWHQL